MKIKTTIIMTAILGILTVHALAFAAEEIKDQEKMMKEKVDIIEVGNTICPVSGQKVGEMGDLVQVVYDGKLYNLCCKMCKKDFLKNPEKFSKIAEEQAAQVKEEMDPDDEAEEIQEHMMDAEKDHMMEESHEDMEHNHHDDHDHE